MNVATRKDMATVSKAWPAVRSVLSPIRSEKQFKRIQVLVDALLDEGADEDLIDTLMTLMHAFEEERHPLPAARGRTALALLMHQHHLKQGDLAEELGSQGVASEVLNGKRALNVRQIRALARRFGVSTVVFIDED